MRVGCTLVLVCCAEIRRLLTIRDTASVSDFFYYLTLSLSLSLFPSSPLLSSPRLHFSCSVFDLLLPCLPLVSLLVSAVNQRLQCRDFHAL